jgi:hypothetical protein
MKCRPSHALMLLSAGLAAFGAYAATPITVANASFEQPALSPGGFVYSGSGAISGWSTSATGGADRGVWWPLGSALGRDGNQIGFAYAGNSFAQALGHAIQANTDYQFSFLHGTYGTSAAVLTVELWAGGSVAAGAVTGGTLLSSVALTSANLSNPSVMAPASLTFTSAAAGPLLGQNLAVRFATSGSSYASFDGASVVMSPIPEPASIALWLAGIGGLGLALRRRQRV